MIEVFTWGAIALAAASAVFVAVLALRRVQLAFEERRQTEAERRVRPRALALVEGDAIEPEPLDRRDAEALARLLARYARWVSGDLRARIAAFFERTGGVAAEIAALRDRRAWRRATAAYALGDMGSREATPALLVALDDEEREVRAAAARSLGRLGAEDAVDSLVFAFVEGRLPRVVAGHALLTIGPAALPALERLVAHGRAEVREFSVELLGLLGDARSASVVAPCLRDASAEVRAKAARALGRLGAEEAAAALRAALRDRIPFVRAAAANALGMVGDRDAVSALVAEAKEDAFFDAAQAAARALARIDREPLVAAARTPGAGRHLHEASDLVDAHTR